MAKNSTHFDVIVVGAGPAGSVTAYNLAKAGISVALLEKDDLPRYKTCGGAVNIRAEKFLDYPITNVIERTIYRWHISSDLKNPFIKTCDRPIVHMTMRDKLDAFLVQQAAEAGVEVIDNCRVSTCETMDRDTKVKTSYGEFTADYLVAADGANSIIRKELDMPSFKQLSVAVEYEVDGSQDALNLWNDMLALDFGNLKGGYRWIFPKGDHFSIGAGGDISEAKKLYPYTEKLLNHYKNELGLKEIRKRTGHKIPILSKNDLLSKNNVLFVGDAGGFVDPLTGEGISLAIWSAIIASRTIKLAIENNSPLIIKQYDQQIYREIMPEIQMAKAMLAILDSSKSFWVWLLLKNNPPFWDFFCEVQRGEKVYMDIQYKFGPLAKSFFNIINKLHP